MTPPVVPQVETAPVNGLALLALQLVRELAQAKADHIAAAAAVVDDKDRSWALDARQGLWIKVTQPPMPSSSAVSG